MMPMAYEQLAYYYDRLMQDAPYDEWQAFIEQTIQTYGGHVKAMIDLGCGTGQITTRLARAGYQMTGVDYSSAMLSVAQQHAYEDQVSVQWLQQDLRELYGMEKQDMAISVCDVINYVTDEKDVHTVFTNAARILKPGGLFVFDVHSRFHVEQHLVNQTFAVVTDDVSYIWFCHEGDEPGSMYHDLTFFVQGQNHNQYTRFDEGHQQKTFSIDFYKQALKQAGFAIKAVSADFSLCQDYLEDEAERLFITAMKRSE